MVYRGIWFEMNQKYEYGDKYSGALGTYTAKTRFPLAIYGPEVWKNFFVSEGKPSEDKRYVHMYDRGEFDHKTKWFHHTHRWYMIKMGLDDPHDNPSHFDRCLWLYLEYYISGGRSKTRLIQYQKPKLPIFTKEYCWDIRKRKNDLTHNLVIYRFGFFNFLQNNRRLRQLYLKTVRLVSLGPMINYSPPSLKIEAWKITGHIIQTSNLYNGQGS